MFPADRERPEKMLQLDDSVRHPYRKLALGDHPAQEFATSKDGGVFCRRPPTYAPTIFPPFGCSVWPVK